MDKYPIAISCFNNALQIANAKKDSVWMAITSGNIGSVYFLQHEYRKALPLVEADYRMSLKYKQNVNSAAALLRLIKMHIDYGQFKPAALELDTADAIMQNCSEDLLALRVEYYNLKSLVSTRKKNAYQAELYHDTSERLRDSVAKRDNIAAIERVRLQWITERSRVEFNSLKQKDAVNSFKQNTIILVLILLIIIIMLVLNRQRLKAQKDKELLRLEKMRMDEKFKNASLMLSGYTESLMQKNQLIDEIRLELANIQCKNSEADVAATLSKMMNAHIMTDENWAEFKKLVLKVHSKFFFNLRNEYDCLSNTDERLLALIKLKLNNKEMAGMLGITVDGIKKAKQRLRKKMALIPNEDLEDVLYRL